MAQESLLERIKREWEAQGWLPETLDMFRMEGEEEENEEEDEGEEDEEDDDDDLVKKDGKITLSQNRFNRIGQRERAKGKRSAERELLKELGLKSKDELKAALADKAAAEDKTKNEATKAKEEADRLKAEAAAERDEVKKERFQTKLERKMSKAKVKDSRLEKAIRLLDLELDADDDEIDEAIDEFKEEYPEFFGKTDDDDEEEEKPRRGSPGVKVPGKPRKKGEPSAADKAKEVLARRHPQTVKS